MSFHIGFNWVDIWAVRYKLYKSGLRLSIALFVGELQGKMFRISEVEKFRPTYSSINHQPVIRESAQGVSESI